MVQTKAKAGRIADRLKPSELYAGFDPVTLIAILSQLIPMIIKCFNPDNANQAKTYVSKRWSIDKSEYGGYDKRLVKAMARQAKNSANKERCEITWDQAYEMGIKVLDDVRTGKDEEADIIIRESFNQNVLI